MIFRWNDCSVKASPKGSSASCHWPGCNGTRVFRSKDRDDMPTIIDKFDKFTPESMRRMAHLSCVTKQNNRSTSGRLTTRKLREHIIFGIHDDGTRRITLRKNVPTFSHIIGICSKAHQTSLDKLAFNETKSAPAGL